MLTLFRYNWQVRNDWFSWCEDMPQDELLKPRVGGFGSILATLFHVIEVEHNWICDLTKRPIFEEPFEPYAELAKLVGLSQRLHPIVEDFVSNWTDDQERKVLIDYNPRTHEKETFYYGEALRHIIAHEIHHIGQLSVWSREIGRQPVTANLIRRGLYNPE